MSHHSKERTMTSRVNSKLQLGHGGRSVAVEGPIITWDPDEISATFSVDISQVNSEGNVVTASGSSTDLYTAQPPPGSTSWGAIATVTDPALRLDEGHATALATATILVQGYTKETYTWTLLTRLV
jgi:hypothetical protein